ncbi:MAG: UvrD-helicase domain-containing protein [Nitrospinae bacterium]|jgi:DNA helicase II / ATP-dependent DNA helicase PcrA|nr:UvrD-helicase domain-containing protein [Nitrospinota bacterium]
MNKDLLNPQQLQSVCHVDGPLIVVAGAGSGKTRVITTRIAHLVLEKGVSGQRILAITFTNKAAAEMKERVRKILGNTDSPPWISTFHSFCLRILRRHISTLGFPGDFVIYDSQDQLSLVKQCMKKMSMNVEAFPPKSILNHISGFKNDFLFPKDIDRDSLPFGNKMKAAEVYVVYQEELKKNNALDFDDLLMWTVRLLREVGEVSELYNDRFQYIMVDEFQDTNLTQYHLLQLISKKHKNVCVVGDDDQSIYRWRGANLENLSHFERDYPGTTVIKLEENYRSTQNILKAAGEVVKENLNRKPKTLWTKNVAGDPIVYYRAEDEVDEARNVCKKIVMLSREKGISFNDMAVLYRTNAQSRVMEDALRRERIQYQVFGGLKFYARKENKDILSYLKVMLNPDDSVALKRIINLPVRGIGKTSLDKVEVHCEQTNISLMQGLRDVGTNGLLSTAVSKKITAFVEMMDGFSALFQSGSPVDLVREVIVRSGYEAMLDKENTIESRTRKENLQELCSAVEQSVETQGQSLQEFLDSTALVADIDSLDDSRGVLPLMTLHTCKGLEFDAVFIIGMEDGLLPHGSSMSDPAEYEEERRLCYVGFTRAKKMLFVSNARRRKIYGNVFNYSPSQFLLSIPEDILEKESSLGGEKTMPSFSSNSASNVPSGPAYAIRSQSRSAAVDQPYSIGSKLLHPAFGTGVVMNRTGNEDDLKLEIFFKRPHGKKKIAVKHAKLIPM